MQQTQRIRTFKLVSATAVATIAAALVTTAMPSATAAVAQPATVAVAQPATLASGTHVIDTSGDTFTPKVLPGVVQIGDTITFNGLNGHNATSTAASVAKFASTPGAATFAYTVTTAGKYTYECTYHSGMTGSFTVAPGGSTPPAPGAPAPGTPAPSAPAPSTPAPR